MRSHFKSLKILTKLLSASLLASGTIGNAEEFILIDLGTLGGSTSFALDVNNSRQVTGNSLVTSDPGSSGSLLRAYLWTSGTMTNLGSVPPLPPSTSTNRFARGYAVNDAGVVVGEFNNDSSRAFVYSGGVISGLTRLAGDNDNGVACDLNNAGVIVGVSSNGTASRPTKWTNSGDGYVPSDLGTIAGTSASTGRAWAINEDGVVVGLSHNSSGTSQATLWNAGSITNLTSLGDGTRFSQAYELNKHLQVVGSSSTGQTVGELIGTASGTLVTRAFHWQEGVMTELPPFDLYTPTNDGPTTNYHSVAMDINDAGVIVGNSQRIAGSGAVATLWKHGVPIDLNTFLPEGSGWILRSAEGINENGDIVGFGTFDGVSRAFLLQKVPDVPAPTAPVSPDASGRLTGPRSLHFSPTRVGSARNRTLVFSNAGAGAIEGLRTTLRGRSSRSFRISAPAHRSIAPGSSGRAKISFRPRTGGLHRAKVIVKSGDSSTAVRVSVTGRGVRPVKAAPVFATPRWSVVQPEDLPGRAVVRGRRS